jgi:N-acetylneuraminate synthase
MLNYTKETAPGMIADAGSRHYGSTARALELVAAAAASSADAIVFDAHALGQQSLSREDWFWLSRVCADSNLHFGATCWEPASVEMLHDTAYKPAFYKVADTATHKADLLNILDGMGRTIILSTGMSTIAQIDESLRSIKKAPVVLLHSTNIYPCPYDKVNLSAIRTLTRRYNIPVGYSSHEVDKTITYAAIGAGAVVIEKGFMLNDDDDPKEASEYALGPLAFKMLAQRVRNMFPAIGDGQKTMYKEELNCEEMVIVEN